MTHQIYKILEAAGAEELEARVKGHLEAGFKPHGPLYVHIGPVGVYTQAMIYDALEQIK